MRQISRGPEPIPFTANPQSNDRSDGIYLVRFRFPEPSGHPGRQPSPKHRTGRAPWVPIVPMISASAPRRRRWPACRPSVRPAAPQPSRQQRRVL